MQEWPYNMYGTVVNTPALNYTKVSDITDQITMHDYITLF